ncbi:MAG: DUF1611 domain-containing protein [Bacteroidetes bacterium]|nr:MAG: DUF1611 domain-containing protein [Bacteroidota bacterium]
MSKPKAVILTHGELDSMYAKTCHGLLRGTDRYEIVGVVDYKYAGRSTTSVLPIVKDVPILASIGDCSDDGIAWCIVGVAFEGGVMPDAFRDQLIEAVKSGMSVVNGLHTQLNDDVEFMQLARSQGVEVIDIRRPKKVSELSFWTGKIKDVQAPRVAVLGTDCAIGKRTTCRFLLEQLAENGVNAQMIYTGQTGWLQGYPHGCILDSTLNDFVSGELENAVLECDQNMHPDLILVEGQSSLRNPSGPCGSEIIISLQSKYVVLQHDPSKEFFEGGEEYGFRIPDLKSEIELIRMLGAEVIAVTLRPSKDQISELDIGSMSQELGMMVQWATEAGIIAVSDLIQERVLSS